MKFTPKNSKPGIWRMFSPVMAVIGVFLAVGMVTLNLRAVSITYTNATAAPWATAANWSPNTNWSTGTWKTNVVNSNLRLNFGNSAAYTANALYTAAEGATTIDVSSGSETRALVIGNGSGNNANLTISGGTLIVLQHGSTIPVLLGTPGALGAMQAALTLNGGNLQISNGSPSAMSVMFRGATNASATLSVSNNSVLAVDQINIGDPTIVGDTANFGPGIAGTINLGGGGTTGTILLRNISNGRPALLMATNNFDGGTLKLSGNEMNGFPLLNTNLVNNILVGGLVVDCQSYNARIISSLVNGTGGPDGGLIKLGGGVLSLYDSCTYNGDTMIKEGTLALDSSITFSSSPIKVASGAALGIIVSSNLLSLPSVSMTNASLNFNYGIFSGGTNPMVNMSGIDLNGTITVNVSGSAFPVTNLTLMTYSGKTGGGSFTLGTLPAGSAAVLTDTGSALVLHVTTASIQTLTWGALVDNVWQTNGSANWYPDNSTYLEYPDGAGDNVIFDDTYGGGMVSISGQVRPSSITVNDTSSYYSFTGSGGISGAGGIAKSGTSTLDIYTSNSFTGAVTVSGGTLFVDNPNALGATNGGTVVSGSASTLELGLSGSVTVNGEVVTINGGGVGGALGALRGFYSGDNVWNGPVVIGSQSARIGTEDSGNLTVSGPITDNGAHYELFIRPGAYGIVTISGTNSAYGSTRFYGDASGTATLQLGADNAFSTGVLSMGPGYLDLNGHSQTVSGINDVSGTGVIYNNGGSPSTLTINNTGNNSTGSAVQDGAAQINLVKLGVGQQNLAVSSSYTGSTVVDGGGLGVVLPMSSSSLTMADSTALSVTVANSSWSPTTMNVTNATLSFNFGAIFSMPPAVLSAGSLNVSGSNVINISATSLPVGQIPLIGYSGKTGAGTFNLGALPTDVQATISDTGSAIVLNVTHAPRLLTWWGGTTGTWNTNGTLDWNTGLAAYQDPTNGVADNVTFNDSASVFNVSITDDVQPASVTVNNTANAYSISGTGRISGTNSVSKSGTNVLTLGSANNYTGGTLVNAGILSFANGALGNSGNVVVFGSSSSVLQWTPGNTEDISSRLKIGGTNSDPSSTLFATLDVGANDVVFNSGVNQGDSGGIVSNVVAKVGSGKLTLAGGATTFGSVFRVNQGTVEVASGGSLNLDGGVAPADAAMVVDNSSVLVSGGALNIADRIAVAATDNSTGVVTVASGVLRSDMGSTSSIRGMRLAGGSGTPKTNDMATVNLDGGSLIVSRIYPGNGSGNTSIVNLNGGLLQSSDNPFANNFMSGLTHAYVKAGGAVIDTGTNSLTISQPLENDGVASPDGGLVKLGGGVLNLAGVNSYTGTTVVSNGTLWVSGALGANSVTVYSGATLGSTGTISGPLVVQAGGMLMPGTGVVTNEILTVNNSVQLAGTVQMQIAKSGVTPVNDQVVGVTDITYGGTLVVTNADNSTLAAGDTFTLFTASGTKTDNFTSVQVEPSSMGLTAVFVPATGQLTLASAATPILMYTKVGSTLQFSWTGGGKLQVQTNSLSKGLGTNWVDYPGGGTSPVGVTINPINQSVFFRLAQ